MPTFVGMMQKYLLLTNTKKNTYLHTYLPIIYSATYKFYQVYINLRFIYLLIYFFLILICNLMVNFDESFKIFPLFLSGKFNKLGRKLRETPWRVR